MVVELELLHFLLLLRLKSRHSTSAHLLVVAGFASLLQDLRQIFASVQFVSGLRCELTHG